LSGYPGGVIWLVFGCIGALSDKYTFGGPGDTAPEPQDTDPVPTVDCDADLDDSSPVECLSGSLHCGDVVHATTAGGDRGYSDRFYESAYCFVPYNSYAGPERIYELQVSPGQQAEVVLLSPCEDMALAVARWEDQDSCPPEENHQILECEGKEASSGGRVRVYSPSGARYLVIVDGPASNFELRVTCP